MMVNSSIFRAYDIRGIYPGEINANTAYLIGRAYVKFLNKKSPKIVVGQDNRLSSPLLFKNLVQGIRDEGGNVIDIGLSTTPMLYFAVAYFKFDGGIEISASHNPSQYNGFKMVREKAIPISEKSGIKEIKNLVLKGFQSARRPLREPSFKTTKKGKITEKAVLKEYVRFNLKKFDLKKTKPSKIIVDTANAVAGIVVPEIFKKTNCKIYHLYSKLDGSFPNHSPDPIIKENLRELQKQVLGKIANLGIAFDGDGDRVVFVDEKGQIIQGDFIIALLASMILKENPGEKILYDVRSSNIIKEVIEKAGGRPIMGRIGHSFIKEKMRKENIIFAGELSGHYYHKNHYFCESPFFVLLKILEEISLTRKSISELIKPYQKYFHSGEINFKVKNKEKKIKELEKRFKAGSTSCLDGLRVDFKNWWFNIRSSHTEPVLRLVVEAKTKKLMEEKKKELIALIK